MWKSWKASSFKRVLQKEKSLNSGRDGFEHSKMIWNLPKSDGDCNVPSTIVDQGLRMACKPSNGFGAVYPHLFWRAGLQNSVRNSLGKSWSSILLQTSLPCKRGLAAQSGVKDQDEETFGSESDESLLDGGFSDGFSSDKDLTDEDLGSNTQQGRMPTPPDDNGDLEADEDGEDALSNDISNTGEKVDHLMVGSLLDMAIYDIVKDAKEQNRDLWLRLGQAADRNVNSVKAVMDIWVQEGNAMSRTLLSFIIIRLRRQMKHRRALEISDWIMTEKPFELTDMDYAIRVDLIAKIHGLWKSVDFFAMIPTSFQTSMVYSTLLAQYVEHNKDRSAAKLVQKVDKLGLGEQTFMYNQLLFLYKKNGNMNKVAETLKFMEEKNIEPDVCTYNLILDIRARKGDVIGLEKVWKRLESNNIVEFDAASYYTLARGYATAGLIDKAVKAAKEVEATPFRSKRVVYQMLLKLYAQLGKADEVERMWHLLSNSTKLLMDDYSIMIESLGQTGEVEKAVEIFEEMVSKVGIKRLHQYNALLSVYANNGSIRKGEELYKKISKSFFSPSPSTFHHLIQMYAKAGKEEKAMKSLLEAKTVLRSSFRHVPWYASYQAVLEMFAEKGDVKNAEKVLQDLKEAGYPIAYKSYCALLKTYSKAEVPPYGFIDRMYADNVLPNPHIRKELKKLNGT